MLDLQEAKWSEDGKRVVVPVTTARETAQVDRLTGKAEEVLCTGINSWDYYGPRWEEFKALGDAHGLADRQWANGGSDGGFWGTAWHDRKVRNSVLDLFAI